MSMEAMYTLRDMLCEELDEIARKGEMSAGDLDTVHKLTDTIKNIDKIEALDGGYSSDGEWEASGSYNRGSSYAGRRGTHYVRGHYSRDSRYRDGRVMYSRGDGREQMIEHLDRMERDASTDKERDAIRRCREQIENG